MMTTFSKNNHHEKINFVSHQMMSFAFKYLSNLHVPIIWVWITQYFEFRLFAFSIRTYQVNTSARRFCFDFKMVAHSNIFCVANKITDIKINCGLYSKSNTISTVINTYGCLSTTRHWFRYRRIEFLSICLKWHIFG